MISLSQIRKVAILGSTGSIGRATLDVMSHLGSRFQVAALSCHRQLDLFETQIKTHHPRYAIATGLTHQEDLSWHEQSYTASLETSRKCGMDFMVEARQIKRAESRETS